MDSLDQEQESINRVSRDPDQKAARLSTEDQRQLDCATKLNLALREYYTVFGARETIAKLLRKISAIQTGRTL